MALYFEEFFEGQEFISGGRTVTETDVVNFAGVSGDFNPLHTDAEFCQDTAYGARIAHGLLVLSMVSGLKSKMGITEGTAIAFAGLRWDFKGPVFFGDTIHFKLTIAEKKESKKPDRGLIRQAIQVLNQRGEVVQEGEHVLLVRRRPPQEA